MTATRFSFFSARTITVFARKMTSLASASKLLPLQSGTVAEVPKRELIRDKDIKLKYAKSTYAFGRWRCAIDLDQQRCQDVFAAVPQKAGLYEIGVKINNCMLTGYAGMTASSLRARLVYQHGVFKDRQDAWMKVYLALGFRVYYRWIVVKRDKTSLGEMETKLINQYNYAYNKQKVTTPRCKTEELDLVWEKRGRIVDVQQNFRALIEMQRAKRLQETRLLLSRLEVKVKAARFKSEKERASTLKILAQLGKKIDKI